VLSLAAVPPVFQRQAAQSLGASLTIRTATWLKSSRLASLVSRELKFRHRVSPFVLSES